jgi:hypothetical protein
VYRRYLLAVLMVILAFNNAELLGLVLENVKSELLLCDTQLGFLGGISYQGVLTA